MELVVYTPTIEKFDLQRAVLGWIVFLYVLLFLMILAVNAWCSIAICGHFILC